MARFCVILPAAGKSSRFGDIRYKKPFAPLNGRTVWMQTAQYFLDRKDVAQVILVVSPEDFEEVQTRFRAEIAIHGITVVRGGKERADSIENAICAIDPSCDLICVHDAARPCLMESWIDSVFQAAEQTGAAILAVPLADSIKKVRESAGTGSRAKHPGTSLDAIFSDPEIDSAPSDGIIEHSLDRSHIWRAQTPQVFRRDWFEQVYADRPRERSAQTTDDAMLFEQAGHPVHVVEASSLNIKITSKTDLQLAEAILKILPKNRKTNFHPFRNDDLFS